MANGKLRMALPEPSLSMTQDAEWCVVRAGEEWRQIRFQDYRELYSIGGLYEKAIYDILCCDSPHVVRSLLATERSDSAAPADDLRVFDFGAGNGMVGEGLAVLGFGDIPARAFVAAFNLIRVGGWVAFNIKEDFLANGDRSGFSGLIRVMLDDGTLELRQRRRYRHRLATDRHPLHYVAMVGIKRRNVPEHTLR